MEVHINICLAFIKGQQMIEPGFEDLGKEVVLNFTHQKNNKGVITSFTDCHVFVRIYGTSHPQAYKRKFLAWPLKDAGSYSQCVNLF